MGNRINYKMQENFERFVAIISIPLIAFVVIYEVHKHNRYDRLDSEKNCYQNCTNYKFSKDADGTTWIDYEFTINGVSFKGADPLYEGTSEQIKDTMIVRYLCVDPEINELVFK
jgi:hypothetical protein